MSQKGYRCAQSVRNIPSELDDELPARWTLMRGWVVITGARPGEVGDASTPLRKTLVRMVDLFTPSCVHRIRSCDTDGGVSSRCAQLC